MIRINGIDYQVRTLSAGDLPVLSALFEKAGPLVSDFQPGQVPSLVKLLPIADDLIWTVSVLLGCQSEDIEKLPLHELIELVEKLATEWMHLNAAYLTEQVTPAIQRLSSAVGPVASDGGAATKPQ